VSKNDLLFATIGVFLGFIIGFTLANALNRSERDQMSTGVMPARSDVSKTDQQVAARPADNSTPAISDDDLREAIAKTDARPDDISLQRNFGLALYRYANQTQDPRYLPDVARLLKRAHDADPKDRDLIVSLANVLFDIGQTSDPARFAEARTYFLKALEMKPDDVAVRTDLGMTYYFGRPSDPQRAIAEYRKALALDPRHELALQSLASALISTGKHDEAQKRIDELQSINPSNPSLPNLRAQLAQSQNAAQE